MLVPRGLLRCFYGRASVGAFSGWRRVASRSVSNAGGLGVRRSTGNGRHVACMVSSSSPGLPCPSTRPCSAENGSLGSSVSPRCYGIRRLYHSPSIELKRKPLRPKR